MTEKKDAPTVVNAVTVHEPGATSDVSVYDDGKFLPEKATVDYWLGVAGHFCQSGIVPKAMAQPAKVLAVWLYAREIGIPAMRALGKLYVIDGNVGMYGELMVELARKGGVWFKVLEHTNEICRVRGYRKQPDGIIEEHTDQFTFEEAKTAKLSGKSNWIAYRRDMLRWRAVARVLRFLAPDLIHGGYLPDEIKALQTVMTDFPPGSPEFLERRTRGAPVRAAKSPGVAKSERKPTGTSRIGSVATDEPEGGDDAAERADLGGSGSEEDDEEDQNGTSPEAARNGPLSDEGDATPVASDPDPYVPPAAAFAPKGGKSKLSPKDDRMLGGWKAFVAGRSQDQVPEGLGPRVAEWWQKGWEAARFRTERAVQDRNALADDALLELDDLPERELRYGAIAALDEVKPESDCPHGRNTIERFFWLTGYRGALLLNPELENDEEAPADEPPGEENAEAPFDRDAWQTEAIDLMDQLGLGVTDGQTLLQRRYGKIVIQDLADEQIMDFVETARETVAGDNDGGWITA